MTALRWLLGPSLLVLALGFVSGCGQGGGGPQPAEDRYGLAPMKGQNFDSESVELAIFLTRWRSAPFGSRRHSWNRCRPPTGKTRSARRAWNG